MEKMKWISVKDALPEVDQYVLWLHEGGHIAQEAIDRDWSAYYFSYFLMGKATYEDYGPITHWMIPELPEV